MAGKSRPLPNMPWNPVAGCSHVSEGCRNCWAAKEAFKLANVKDLRVASRYKDVAMIRGSSTNGRAVFDGTVKLVPAALFKPLTWITPRRVVVCSMSDLFHPSVPLDYIRRVFDVMLHADGRRHTYLLITKRPERMQDVLNDAWWWNSIGTEYRSHIWLGVSVEDQVTADARIPLLRGTIAANRMVAFEPLLGEIDPRPLLFENDGIGHVVVGGEVGQWARPMHPAWARVIRDHCAEIGVPFAFRQWGQWMHARDYDAAEDGEILAVRKNMTLLTRNGRRWGAGAVAPTIKPEDEAVWMKRAPKGAAGRKLDGKIHKELPTPTEGANV